MLIFYASVSLAAPAPACTRDPDFTEWPGGRALRLDLGDVSVGTPFSFDVTGGLPGERLEVHVGGPCGLDCPAELDGACFQPAGSAMLAEVFADAVGTATGLLDLGNRADEWLVVQVVTADRPLRALSQAFVVPLGSPANLAAYRTWNEISPMVIQGLSIYSQEFWWWPVAPGRRVHFVNTLQTGNTGCWVVEGGISTDLDCRAAEGAEAWFAGPSAWYFDSYDGDWTGGGYELDIQTLPTDLPVDWYPDGDGDGYGDPGGVPVSTTTPVPGHSPDLRDCDDADPRVHPVGLETCDDGLDQDCDGADRPCTEGSGLGIPATGTRLVGPTVSGMGLVHGAADLDGDGRPDAILGTETATLIYSLDRTDRDTPLASYAFAYQASGAIGADVTGDGIADLVSVEPLATVVLAGPLSGPAAGTAATLPGEWHAASSGDLAGDETADLLIWPIERGELEIFAGPLIGEQTVADAIVPVAGNGLRDAEVADVDGDGLDDVWTNEVCLHIAPLPVAGSVPVGCVDDGPDDNLSAGGMLAFDVDLDGYGDLVVGDHPAGLRVLAAPLAGDVSVDVGSQTTVEVSEMGSGWAVGATPDRDGDGLTELLVSESRAVWSVSTAAGGRVLASDGVALFSTPSYGETPGLLGGDFDADGVGDVIIAAPYDNFGSRYQAGVAYVLWGGDAVAVVEEAPVEPEEELGESSAPAAKSGCASSGSRPGLWAVGLLALVARRRSARAV